MSASFEDGRALATKEAHLAAAREKAAKYNRYIRRSYGLYRGIQGICYSYPDFPDSRDYMRARDAFELLGGDPDALDREICEELKQERLKEVGKADELNKAICEEIKNEPT